MIRPLSKEYRKDIRAALKFMQDGELSNWDTGFNQMTKEEQQQRIADVKKIKKRYARILEKIDYLYVCMPDKNKETSNVEKVRRS